MNNKEAIDILNNKLNIAYFSSEDNEALDLAIKALEDARPTVRHVILNHPRFGKCDACYDEARQLLYFDCITKELLDKYGWTFEEGTDDVVQGNSNI